MSGDDELGVEAVAAFELHFGRRLDDLATRVSKIHQQMLANFAEHASLVTKATSTSAPASGAALLNLGGPEKGRWWDVRTIAVIGSDDHTSLAGTNVALYAGSADGTAQGSVADLVLPGTQQGSAVTVPANAQFARKQLVLYSPMKLYALVYGATSGQQLRAVVRAWDSTVLELPG